MSQSQSHRQRHKSLELLQEFSIPLVAGVVFAVLWANIAPDAYHHFIHYSPFGADSHFNFHFVMNDIFMAIFFGLAAKEIAESVLPGGALSPFRKAINPLLGTLGGVIGPVGVYFAWVAFTGDSSIANGWGIPTATDIALAWLIARLVFGKTHPAVSFLLLLAVADDAIGLGIIAIFYPDPLHPTQPAFLALVAGAMVIAEIMRRKGTHSYWPYLVVPGLLSWAGFYLAHLHPALALVPIIPFMPHAARDEGLYVQHEDNYTDTMNQFEHAFKLPVDVGLFGFGLANAGVEFSSVGNATAAVLAGLLLGKTVGIFGFSYFGTLIGFPLPQGMTLRSLFTAGVIAGIGLTVALFVAGVAFTDPALQGAAKMGALLSAFIAPLAFIIGRMLGVHRELAGIEAGATEIVVLDSDINQATELTENLSEDLGPIQDPAPPFVD